MQITVNSKVLLNGFRPPALTNQPTKQACSTALLPTEYYSLHIHTFSVNIRIAIECATSMRNVPISRRTNTVPRGKSFESGKWMEESQSMVNGEVVEQSNNSEQWAKGKQRIQRLSDTSSTGNHKPSSLKLRHRSTGVLNSLKLNLSLCLSLSRLGLWPDGFVF